MKNAYDELNLPIFFRNKHFNDKNLAFLGACNV